MKPYYQDDSVTIYQSECLEFLKTMDDASIQCVVTSPPYNTLPKSHKPSGLHAERKTGINKWIDKAAKGYADSMPEQEYQLWLYSVINECIRVCSGLVWVNHKIRYRDGIGIHPLRFLDFPLYTEVIWDRRVSMALNCKRFSPSHEALWAFGTPNYWADNYNKLMSVWQIPFDRSADNHPCAFPLEIASRPIQASCPQGAIVLDPFSGSGTVGRAAKNLGRKAILIEKEERYCEMAAIKMAQEVIQF